ncbi:hypothetical protein ACROYT_G029467 [Oculina patagonica]
MDFAGGILVYANFFPFPHHKLNSTPVESHAVSGEQDCIAACTESSQCRSLNFKPVPDENGKFICHLLDTDKFNSSQLFHASVDFHHYSFAAPCEHNPCKHGGTCEPIHETHEYKCNCVPGTKGKLCDEMYKSCAELFDAGVRKSGIYLIKDQNSELRVYCDQEYNNGGWTMVFKVVSNVSADIYQLWSSAYSLNEKKTEALNVNSSFKAHYKNRLVLNWQTANPKEVRVALYKDQNEILSIVFNGSNSDNENWFSKDRILDSPWTDLINNPPTTFFSIAGDSGRRFYISGPHNGCETDYGWLSVIMQHCVYERRFPTTTVMYSKLETKTDWNVYENVDVADTLLVYIR